MATHIKNQTPQNIPSRKNTEWFHTNKPSRPIPKTEQTTIHTFKKNGRNKKHNTENILPECNKIKKEVKSRHPDVILGIVSNTDPIFYKLLKNIGLFETFSGHIYLSYELNLAKPDRAIFQYALDDIISKQPHLLEKYTREEILQHCFHIGDELKNDLEGAEAAGWTGILLDRNDKYGFLSNSISKPMRDEYKLSIDKIDNNSINTWEASTKQTDTLQLSERKYVVSNLEVLEELFP
ncbi:AAC_HP2_G0041080.mRNA.1.CDS.1 [Saccharomyces cerevisiae]|nr:AAC_HP2_G0041080.mRNA.1.CDS.1 [Saccharomyces cerevisiae]CAI6700273.1 AAC_HP2_G0041080.mRNA.1.CDS.1 [Saccharomyces cerevisiae]